jgi:Zn-finger nucleic acid-binding protein
MSFAGAKHCSHCGQELTAAEIAVCTGHLCPRCQKQMRVMAVGDTFLEECGHCGGVWVDAASFQQLVDNRETRAATLGIGTLERHNPEPLVKYVPCPLCGKLMLRVNFARSSGVIVDYCKGHGTWFDHDELRRILEFIDAGGLGVAREREKRELEEQRKRLVTERATAVPEAKSEDYGRVIAAARFLLQLLFS